MLSQQDFFFVAEWDEISNLDLIKDIDRIIKMEEVFSMTLSRFYQDITGPKHKLEMHDDNAPTHIIHRAFKLSN